MRPAPSRSGRADRVQSGSDVDHLPAMFGDGSGAAGTSGGRMTTETKPELTCRLCAHEWVPRVKGRLPIACPRCHRYDWNKER